MAASRGLCLPVTNNVGKSVHDASSKSISVNRRIVNIGVDCRSLHERLLFIRQMPGVSIAVCLK